MDEKERLDKESVLVEIAGKTRRLRYDINALCALEAELGMPLLTISKLLSTGRIWVTHIRAILWAGLLHEEPSLTVKQAGDLLGNMKEIPTITKAAMEAMESAWGEPEAEKAAPALSIPKNRKSPR